MNIFELKKQIKDNSFHAFNIFVGEEVEVEKIYTNQMAKVRDLPIYRYDSVIAVYNKISSRGFLESNEPALYIVRNDNNFTKEEKNWDKVVSALGMDVLVVIYDKLDSRLKFTKYFKDRLTQFDVLPNPVLEKHILIELPNMKIENVDKLIQICNRRYDIILQEIDKIKSYGGEVNRTFKKLVSDGTISQFSQVDVFTFAEEVCKQDFTKALKSAEVLKTNGVQAINILGTLYSRMKTVMLLQVCTGDVEKTTGISNGQAYYTRPLLNYYHTYNLVTLVKDISSVVDAIKDGRIDSENAVQYILVDCFVNAF